MTEIHQELKLPGLVRKVNFTVLRNQFESIGNSDSKAKI